MSNWSAGYVAEIEYTHGYYRELSPLWAKIAFLSAGLAPPTANGVHCELGFGQGVSINIHAAASDSVYWGTDFNPAQTRFAQEVAGASGAQAHLTDQSFAEFCTRSDLPDFDSIGLHGIWSWINDTNREIIVDFLKRKLKVGGVAYISYNTQPGWAAMLPFRDLLTEHSEVMGAPGLGITKRIDMAIEFAEKLLSTKPGYLNANPAISDTFNRLKRHERSYLAHEYFNRDWLPMPFSKMAQWLEPAKLSYGCSADYLTNVDALHFTAEHLELLGQITDAGFRETVKDFVVNQQFRRDFWVKGARRLNKIEQLQTWMELRVVLTTPAQSINLKVQGALGEAEMQAAIYQPIIDILADHKPRTVAQIIQSLDAPGIAFAQVTQAIMILAGTGSLHAVQDDVTTKVAKKRTDKLNSWILNLSRRRDEIRYLASPVTGTGVSVNHIHQLFLAAMSQGIKGTVEIAKATREILKAQGRRLLVEGAPIEDHEETLRELVKMAEEFSIKRIPILRALQIV